MAKAARIRMNFSSFVLHNSFSDTSLLKEHFSGCQFSSIVACLMFKYVQTHLFSFHGNCVIMPTSSCEDLQLAIETQVLVFMDVRVRVELGDNRLLAGVKGEGLQFQSILRLALNEC